MFLSWEIHLIKEEKLDWETPSGWFPEVEICLPSLFASSVINFIFLAVGNTKLSHQSLPLSSVFASAIYLMLFAMGNTLIYIVYILLPKIPMTGTRLKWWDYLSHVFFHCHCHCSNRTLSRIWNDLHEIYCYGLNSEQNKVLTSTTCSLASGKTN